MRILYIGDVFGHVGREAIKCEVAKLKQQEHIDLVIANAENVSNGKGLKKTHYEELVSSGVDYFTMGNHTWDDKDIYELFLTKTNIIRPGNVQLNANIENDYAQFSISFIVNKIRIRLTNIMGGSVLSKRFSVISPFAFMHDFLQELKQQEQDAIHIVDFHAESTAEKAAFFRMFEDDVDAVLGTHTHVQTNDAFVSNKHTAFITDIGLTGARNSIIGADMKPILQYYRGEEQYLHISSANGIYQFCAVILDVNEQTKQIDSIKPLFIVQDKN